MLLQLLMLPESGRVQQEDKVGVRFDISACTYIVNDFEKEGKRCCFYLANGL